MEYNNNENTKGVPTVPDAIPGWKLYDNIYNNFNDLGDTEDDQVSSRFARRLLLKKLNQEANLRCESCSGYGHVKAGCKTTKTLNLLRGADIYYKGFIDEAEAKVDYQIKAQQNNVYGDVEPKTKSVYDSPMKSMIP